MNLEWELAKVIDWRRLLRLEPPVSIKARKRENGRWIYREPTEQEIADFLSTDAW